MKDFTDYNPIVIFIYFLSVTGITMFNTNPVVITLSLSGALMCFLLRNGSHAISSHFFFLAMFVVMALVNPIFNHNGLTVLFVSGNNPVTLEALIYGIAASAMIISVIYWFRSFSQIMSSDKLLYLFGSASPKTALIISMALRYIPMFKLQTKKVNQTQKALGLYKEDNAMDYIRGGTRVFSVMVTWALENGIITADSMSARGYGACRRIFFSRYRFKRHDAVLLTVIMIMLISVIFGMLSGGLDFRFYPEISGPCMSPVSIASYVSYAILAFMPSFLKIWDDIKWKYLRLKI